MSKKLVCCFCILFLAISVFLLAEDKISIHGIVVDAGNQPLTGVALYLKETSKNKESFTFTGVDGKFEFSDLNEGNYELRFELEGFQSISAPINLKNEGVRIVEVTLRKIASRGQSRWPATAQRCNSPAALSSRASVPFLKANSCESVTHFQSSFQGFPTLPGGG
jgi:Carboxypeptidase regulatory-like domain